MWRLVMLDVLMLSGRICPKVRWRGMSIAIVPHDHEGKGESVCMAIRLTLRKGRRCGTHILWCKYVVESVVDMSLVSSCVGVVKLWSGSIIVQ